MAALPGVELLGVRLAGRAAFTQPAEELGWPVVDLQLGRFSVSTLFRRQQRQLQAFIERFRPDIIHAQGADAAGFLAVSSGRPAIITLHGILSECAKFRTNPVKRMRERLQAAITEQVVVERARHIVAISPYIARYYRDRLRGTLHDIPNPVAPEFFGVVREPEAKRFLFAGRISRGKGVLDLVQAVAHEPRAVDAVTLAGAAPEPEFSALLQSEIARSGLQERIRLAGLLDEPALLEEFGRATALMLPSYQETAPMVIQQAMAAGLPVIATRAGGIPDLIAHEVTGLLFDAGDVVSLARHLRRLGDDRDLGSRLAVAARAKAGSFASHNVATATLEAYRKVISGN
jgi:glycosyltransferase involved in cell wall biosynthesis